MCPVRAIFLEFTKNALKMRPLRALFFEFTKNSHEMCPLRALSLKFTKSAHKFALFQHHIPCPQKMLDARLLYRHQAPLPLNESFQKKSDQKCSEMFKNS